jgi:N-acetyl-gamma-glutamyl-phosphate reductase / acetylglutamate kinase
VFVFPPLYHSLILTPLLDWDTETRLLYSIGTKAEGEHSLHILPSSSHLPSSATLEVINVEGAVLDNVEDIAATLNSLYRVGLYPVITHGAGPQLNEILEMDGVVPDYIDRIRITGSSWSFSLVWVESR